MKMTNRMFKNRIPSVFAKKQLVLSLLFFTAFCLGQNTNVQKDSVLTDISKNHSIAIEDLNINLDYFKWKSDLNLRNDSIKIFSLSPISKRVKEVNGFALGVGHYENCNIEMQTVRGLNVEASPLTLFLFTYGINVPFEAIFVGINDNVISNTAFFDDDKQTYIKVNGLNISSGGFMSGAELSGVNISVLSTMNKMNGFSISGILNTKNFAGLSVCGLANLSDSGNGVQIGVSNVSRKHNGLQIGLFNHSKNLRGLQFGLWNTNGKRKLPLINWQFKK